MPSLPVVIIWLLAVMLVGLTITGLCLYLTRDSGQRASGTRPPRRRPRASLASWRESRNAVLGISAPPAAILARCEHGYPALADGTCALERVSATNLVQQPAIDELRVAALSHRLIDQSIRAIYADIEARQVRELAQTAWSTWQV